jgi:hypothetical protein
MEYQWDYGDYNFLEQEFSYLWVNSPWHLTYRILPALSNNGRYIGLEICREDISGGPLGCEVYIGVWNTDHNYYIENVDDLCVDSKNIYERSEEFDIEKVTYEGSGEIVVWDTSSDPKEPLYKFLSVELRLGTSPWGGRVHSYVLDEINGQLITAVAYGRTREGLLISLWDLESGQEIVILYQGDAFGFNSLTLSPNENVLAVCGDRKSISINLNLEYWLDQACHIVGRNLTEEEWQQFIGEFIPYEATCSQFPVGGYPIIESE